MTDNYEQMTNDELREEVADRLGWVNLDWDDNALFGDNPSGMHNPEDTPNWPEDCNAALELHGDACVASMFDDTHNQWTAWVNPDLGKSYTGFADTDAVNPRARAICIAWLRWQDAQEAK